MYVIKRPFGELLGSNFLVRTFPVHTAETLVDGFRGCTQRPLALYICMLLSVLLGNFSVMHW